MDTIKDFYSKIKFPGLYTMDQLSFYDEILINPFLKEYDNAIQDCQNIIDIGCGTGFITNLLARRYPNKNFTAIDFSDSIDYAREFTKKHRTKNIIYYKQDFLTWDPKHQYDAVICNGVLHHIPNYQEALNKIKEISANKIAIGLYNPYGKLAKKIVPISYRNETLYLDQEQCPFELTFNDNEVKNMFKGYQLNNVYPSIMNKFVNFYNLLNYSNGGLTIYTFTKL